MNRKCVAALILTVLVATGSARAETVRIARQFGISYLPLILMQDGRLLEQEARARGLDLTAEWLTFTGGPPINDALISGNIDLAAGGVGPMLTLWGRTRTNLKVKALAALGNMPVWLMSNRPEVSSIADLTGRDRIALPGVKVSIQAVILQMAARQAFGRGEEYRLDPLTVTMGHPDGQAALMSGNSEITAHFTSAPFMYEEQASPRIHRVLNSYDVLGGPHTFNLVWSSSRYYEANPKVVAAFLAALERAMALIRDKPLEAAGVWVRVEKTRLSPEQAADMVRRPENEWTTTPARIMQFARFMAETGALPNPPQDWREVFFPSAQGLDGS
ncbi:MAG: ABC transporter substrate-binding protein [Acetobacteraceae bacterium]|nr:ABC transporter substrate-binding protein [Acetobacteraceae bacterium]